MKRRWPLLITLLIIVIGVVGAVIFINNRPKGDAHPGTGSVQDFPNQPDGSVNFKHADFGHMGVICWGVAFYKATPKGFLSNYDAGRIREYRIDVAAQAKKREWIYAGCRMNKTGATMVLPIKVHENGHIDAYPDHQAPGGLKPLGATLDGQSKYLYLSTNDGIYQYAVSGGSVKPLAPACVSSTIKVGRITLSHDGKYAYGVNFGEDRIYQFSVGANGALSSMAPQFVSAVGGPSVLQIDPNGRFLWCLARRGQIIQRFSIGATGALSPMAPAVPKQMTIGGEMQDAIGYQPNDFVIDPTGKFAYVARYRYNSILQFVIQPDGSFNFNAPISAPGTGAPVVIRMSPEGKFLFALDSQNKSIAAFAVDAQGRLHPANPSVINGAMEMSDVLYFK